MAQGAYIGAPNFELKGLPSGYTQLEYVVGNGASYFDTGFAPDIYTRVVAKFHITSDTGWIFGARNSNSNNATYQFAVNKVDTTHLMYCYFRYNQTTTHTLETNGIFDATGRILKFHYLGLTCSKSANPLVQSYSLWLFNINNVGNPSTYSSGKLYYCQIYDNGTLVRDYVPCKNSSGVVGLYDMVNKTFINSATSTAFTAGPTRMDVAHKIRKMYVGVNGVAQRVKKVYIGVGGKARPCWTGGKITYYGNAPDLRSNRPNAGTVCLGDEVLFVSGGDQNANNVKHVDKYSRALVRTSLDDLPDQSSSLAGTVVGEHAVFAGGYVSSNRYNFHGAFAYNKSFTLTILPDMAQSRGECKAVTVGNYALFGGGCSSTSVDAYNTALSRSNPVTLSSIRFQCAATCIGGNAIFAGGYASEARDDFDNDYGVAIDTVDVIKPAITRTSLANLTQARMKLAAASTKNHAVFAGGYMNKLTYDEEEGGYYSSSFSLNAVDVYSTSLAHSTPTSLLNSRDIWMVRKAAVSLGQYAMFNGGNKKQWEIYDAALTHTLTSETFENNYTLLESPVAVSFGDYALFTVGGSSSSSEAMVRVFTV